MTYIITMVMLFFFFFFNDTATTEIYTLSLHDALPISDGFCLAGTPLNCSDNNPCTLDPCSPTGGCQPPVGLQGSSVQGRSEEHTSELQSPCNLVCRLLLEKKKKKNIILQYVHRSNRDE